MFEGLGNMGEGYQVQLNPGAKPFALFTPRQVLPLLLRKKVSEELHRMESMGVISCVYVLTQSCTGMVVVFKNPAK